MHALLLIFVVLPVALALLLGVGVSGLIHLIMKLVRRKTDDAARWTAGASAIVAGVSAAWTAFSLAFPENGTGDPLFSEMDRYLTLFMGIGFFVGCGAGALAAWMTWRGNRR